MAKVPGKSNRKVITLQQLLQKFPHDEAAEQWFVEQRWPQGIRCPRCGSPHVQTDSRHPRMPFRCRAKACGKFFSAKTGTVMERSKIGYQDWLIAAFLVAASLQSVSSMELHRDLGVTQKTAWFLAQRVRKAMLQGEEQGEVDRTYLGGKRRNMPSASGSG